MMRVRVPLRAAAALVPAMAISLALFVIGYPLVKSYNHSAAYPAYMESLAMAPGDVGAEPVESTPEARSIADLETMDTFYAVGERTPSNAYTLDGHVYYVMTPENGDRVLARINFDNAEETDEWHLRLPVGRWVPLELSDEGEKRCPITRSIWTAATIIWT